MEDLSNKSASEFLGANGPLSKLQGFVSREGQLKLTSAVEEALASGELLIAEAGTGTGKTFAYLVPALLNSKVTVISTASKALQDQIVKKDLPMLFKLLKREPNYMVLKGFNNYLCLSKYMALCENYNPENSLDFKFADGKSAWGNFNSKILALLKKIVVDYQASLAKPCGISELGEINSRFPKDIVQALTMERMQCPEGKCPYYNRCCAFKARERAALAQVVVVNHALFFSSIRFERVFDDNAPPIMLPKYKQIIFDEAHELAEIGREHLSSQVGSLEIKNLTNDLSEYLRKSELEIKKPLLQEIESLSQIFSNMYNYLNKLCPDNRNARNLLVYKYSDYSEGAFNEEPFYSKSNDSFLNKARDMYKALKSFSNLIKMYKDQDEKYFEKLDEYVEELLFTLVSCMTIDDKHKEEYPAVASVTVSKYGFSMRYTPLEISNVFGAYLKQCKEHGMGVILTSATLSVEHKFGKFRADLGISKDESSAIEIPTFFDYKHHAALYTSENFPEISCYERERLLWEQVRDFVKASPGGVFILTTSISALNKLKEIIREDKEQERQVLCQYEKLSNTQMLKAFKEDGRAILIGSISFWAGVDVRGEALSLVIIDKLPFTSPQDPLFSERCRYYERLKSANKNRSFLDLSVPEAVIALRQGVGRLIRHENDCGAMIICDPRIRKRNYGNIFLQSLPPMQPLQTPQALLSFLRELGAKSESRCN